MINICRIYLISFFIAISSCTKDIIKSEVGRQELIDFCISNIHVPSDDNEFNTYLKSRTKYSCYSISHYQYIFSFISSEACSLNECLVEVLNDSIISTEIITLDEFNPKGSFCVPETIVEIFDLIALAVDRNVEIPKELSLCNPVEFPFATTCELADRVRITYDEELGIPISVHIDWNLVYADEEYNAVIKDFEIIK